MLAGVELDDGLPFRAHAVEQVLACVGDGRAAGPATEARPERGVVARGLGEQEPPPVLASQVTRAKPERPLAERRIEHNTAPRPQHHAGPAEQPSSKVRDENATE